MRSISIHVFFVVRLRYMRSAVSVHLVDISTLQAVFFMLKVCKCWMDVWSVMLNFLCAIERSCSQHQTLITAGQSESESTSTNTPPLMYRFTFWGPLKGRRTPAPSQYTLQMLELRLLRNHPRKALFKINTPLWSAELTSVSASPRMIEGDGPLPLLPASTTPSSRRDWWFNDAWLL